MNKFNVQIARHRVSKALHLNYHTHDQRQNYNDIARKGHIRKQITRNRHGGGSPQNRGINMGNGYAQINGNECLYTGIIMKRYYMKTFTSDSTQKVKSKSRKNVLQ